MSAICTHLGCTVRWHPGRREFICPCHHGTYTFKPLLYLLRGGPKVNPNTLTRFYNFHIGVLPALMTLLLAAHIALVRIHSVSRLQNDPRTETYPFFPDHMLREMIIGLLLLIGLVNYIIFFPPTVGALATPGNTPGHIRPEWYFFPTYPLTHVADSYTRAQLIARIQNGVPVEPKLHPSGPAPPLHMPAFKDLLTEQQMHNLVDYLFSLEPKNENLGF